MVAVAVVVQPERRVPRRSPADFTTYQGAGYRFAYPQDWQRGSKTGALGEAIVTVLSGPRTDGVHCYGFASRKDNYSSDLTAAVRSLLDVAGDKTQQILQNKEVHVADTQQGFWWNAPTT